MRRPLFYRTFFAFRPNTTQRRWLEHLVHVAGQRGRRIQPDNFHLTLCVIAELLDRDPFVVARAKAALDGDLLSSCSFWLGQVRGGSKGAAVHALRRQRDIQKFYKKLIALLAARDIVPFHRKSGFRPHVTLGYDPCAFDPFELPCEWVPDELLLIESEVGNGVHNVIASWPLLPPTQGRLALGDPFKPNLPLLAA